MRGLLRWLLIALASCYAHDGAGEPLPLTLAWRALVDADTRHAKEEEDAEARNAHAFARGETPAPPQERSEAQVQIAASQVLQEAAAIRRMHTCAGYRDWACCASAAQYLIEAGTPAPEAPAYLALASQALDPSRAASPAAVQWVAAQADGLAAVRKYDDALEMLELFAPLDRSLAVRIAPMHEQARLFAADQAAARAIMCLGAGDRLCFRTAAQRSLELGPSDPQARWLAPLLRGSPGDDGLREAAAFAVRLADAGRWADAIAMLELVVELDPAHDELLQRTRTARQALLSLEARKKLWRTKCAGCHGDDGAAQTRTGRRHQIASMADAAWQERWPDAAIERAITHGVANTPMRAFERRLSAEEIAGLVGHIRSFRPQ